MTRQDAETVRLSSRDWLGVVTLTLTVVVLLGSQFMRHDRLLTEVLVKQQVLADRVEMIEAQISRIPVDRK